MTSAAENRERIRRTLRASQDPHRRVLADYTIFYGWCPDGVDPFRFGWWAISPAGAASYLGRSSWAVRSEKVRS